MTPERWRRVEEIYHAALARDVSQRSAFLDEACAGNAELRREVEALLAQGASAEGFLDRGAVAVATPMVSDIPAGTLSGRRIGVYQVLAPIGAGGMGEVYRARDTKLGRDVAIKILPAEFTSHPDRLARFEREARILAALNHPHIGGIHGVEDSDGVRALVLELVEGETLADRIARAASKGSGLPVKKALDIARQIADALASAHEKGIIHRDLKPANIKITPEGVVKVLDFGLAKTASHDGVPRLVIPRSMLSRLRRVDGEFSSVAWVLAICRPVISRTVWMEACLSSHSTPNAWRSRVRPLRLSTTSSVKVAALRASLRRPSLAWVRSRSCRERRRL